MKRYMMTMMVAIFAWTGMNAMDYETAREQAYYLTDKMAYELNLNEQQYNDAYEINLDYLLSIRTEADLRGDYLAYRNDDLRAILYDWQWTAFRAVDYLFRPLWWLNGGWYMPVYRYYTHDYYFYHHPRIYWDYRGGHGRFYHHLGYYHDRRPHWNGGLRGEHRGLVGHPHPGGGRFGNPNHGGHGQHHPNPGIGSGRNHGSPSIGSGHNHGNPGIGSGHNHGNPGSGSGRGHSNPSFGSNQHHSNPAIGSGRNHNTPSFGNSRSQGFTRGGGTSIGGHESRGSRGSGRR